MDSPNLSGIYLSPHLLVVLPSMLVLFSNTSPEMIGKIADLALDDLTCSIQLVIPETEIIFFLRLGAEVLERVLLSVTWVCAHL